MLQRLHEKIIALKKENNSLKKEVSELEETKGGLVHHAQYLEVDVSHSRLRCEDLMKINTRLLSEITE